MDELRREKRSIREQETPAATAENSERHKSDKGEIKPREIVSLSLVGARLEINVLMWKFSPLMELSCGEPHVGTPQ